MTFTVSVLPLLVLLCVASCTTPDNQLPTATRPAQPAAVPAALPRQATRFDSLTSTRQVQQLLRTLPDYQTFIVSDSIGNSIPWSCANRPLCVAPGPISSWVKADFDGNGRTDLLVTGYTGPEAFERDIICVLDSGKHTLGRIELTDEKHQCGVPQLIQVSGKPAIRYASYQKDDWAARNVELTCRADTLVFGRTQFIEYNARLRDYQIQSVTFNTTECYGMCPVFNLQLDRYGNATYQARSYTEKEGNFTAAVDARKVAELWRLLNYLNFPKLRNHYNIGYTDFPTYTLTIIYANGQVKSIEDYGGQGTYGLSQVYGLLFALRTSQPWK